MLSTSVKILSGAPAKCGSGEHRHAAPYTCVGRKGGTVGVGKAVYSAWKLWYTAYMNFAKSSVAAVVALMACMPQAQCAPASAAKAGVAEVRNVRFSSPKLTVSREKSGSSAVVTGQVHVDMSFARNMARKPVLRIVAVCEADGVLMAFNAFLDRPRTCDTMKRAEIMNAYKQAGIDIPSSEREKAYSDPARFTPLLSEVAKDAYSTAVYGTADVGKGFFRIGKCATMPKVVVFRLELWQNGALAAQWESSKSGLGKYALPADWHVWGKYPQKFKYIKAQ